VNSRLPVTGCGDNDQVPLVWRGAALLILAALLGVTTYRAVTQSITHDEAVTLRDFVAGPFLGLFRHYDANNHVLYSLLARVSISLFGKAEWALRLPSLAAALLLSGALFALCRRLYGDTWWLPVSIAVAACNGYLLDFLSLARGYGLAIALFVTALALVTGERIRWIWTGLALGGAVAANLTLLFPAAALGVTLLFRHGRPALRCLFTGAVSCLVVVGGPMINAQRDNFYYGAASPWHSVASLVGGSVYHNVNDRSGPVMFGVAFASIVLAAVVISSLRDRDGFLFLLAGTIAGTLLLTSASHVLFALPLPFGRTGLCWILLFGLGLVALAHRFYPRAVLLAVLPLAACYNSWTVTSAADWEYDAGTKAIALRMGGLTRVAASWPLEPALNYYRERLGLAGLAPISRGINPRDCKDCDGYALFGDDLAIVQKKKLRVIYEDPIARSVLAVVSPSPQR
jgi:hypothetical protein